MPEGHTTHRLAARHQEMFAGGAVRASSPQGRFDARKVTGLVVDATEAYGKHLLHHYNSGFSLHIHLGLYGKFTHGVPPMPEPFGQIRLRLYNRRHWLDLRGPSACELFDPQQVKQLLDRLGADPLRTDADPDRAYARISRSNLPLAALLLDQSIVAGTGLIFVTESLFRAGLLPTTPGRVMSETVWKEIWADLCALMAYARETGRVDTVHSVHTPEAMGRPPRVDPHGGEVYAYRRAGQPCLVCGSPIQRGTLAGRNAYWCGTCQVADVN